LQFKLNKNYDFTFKKSSKIYKKQQFTGSK